MLVRARGGETPDAAAARAAETLAGVPGVTEARALEREKAEDLIAPWLGDVPDLDDLPVPRLVTVDLDRESPATAADLDRRPEGRRASTPPSTTTAVWIEDIERAAGLARWSALGVFLLIAAAAGAVIAFATRAGLAARRDVVEVLHLSGAEDGFIAGLFQTRFARSPPDRGPVRRGGRRAVSAREPAPGRRRRGPDARPAARLDRPAGRPALPAAGRPGRRRRRPPHRRRHPAGDGLAVRIF